MNAATLITNTLAAVVGFSLILGTLALVAAQQTGPAAHPQTTAVGD